jgi:hypothetical protein
MGRNSVSKIVEDFVVFQTKQDAVNTNSITAVKAKYSHGRFNFLKSLGVWKATMNSLFTSFEKCHMYQVLIFITGIIMGETDIMGPVQGHAPPGKF